MMLLSNVLKLKLMESIQIYIKLFLTQLFYYLVLRSKMFNISVLIFPLKYQDKNKKME